MTDRDEVTLLFNKGNYQTALELGLSLLSAHPSDIRLADIVHRVKKKLCEAQLQFSNQWFAGWQGSWVDALERKKWDRMRTHKIIEIGSFEGQCTSWLTDVLVGSDNSQVIAIDPFTVYWQHGARRGTKRWPIQSLQ